MGYTMNKAQHGRIKFIKKINKDSSLFELDGKTFECHPTFLRASYDLLSSVCNGCGPGSAKFDLVPDKPFWLDFEWPCNSHDWDYFIYSTVNGKIYADKRARNNWGAAVVQHKFSRFWPGFIKKRLRKRAALLPQGYFTAVKVCGNPSFFETNKDTKEANDNVRERFARELEHIGVNKISL